MRTSLLCCALLLALSLVPAATAHNPTPEPLLSYIKNGDPEPCPTLPLYDAALCTVGNGLYSAGRYSSWGLDFAAAYAHYTSCHIVGGPACVS